VDVIVVIVPSSYRNHRNYRERNHDRTKAARSTSGGLSQDLDW